MKKLMAIKSETHNTLISLAAEAAELSRMLLQCGGELTPEIEARLDVNERTFADKADAYSFVIEDFTSQAQLWKKRKDACAFQQKIFESQIDRMKTRIKEALKISNKTEAAGSLYKFQVRKSQPALRIDDESKIPSSFKIIIQSTTIDTEKLKSALMLGFSIPGAHLEETGSLYILENSHKE